ncbi:MAG: hypothetical protein EBU90_04210 [Proteobacteria bacterium]|nr:hypothetical protein [Pseudomonadota bacterium]NBP13903.1 hypothetical protein [bacterium]
MSGNIKDTRINQIKEQVQELQTEIRTLRSQGENPTDWEDTLKRKYKYLSTTSESLFKLLLHNYDTPRFNQSFFDQTLQLMLNRIEDIQQAKVSQHDASVNIGEHLATTFIPQLRK